MILYYISSNGNQYDLKVGHFRMRTADFHNYMWEPQVIEQQYGARPYRFDKAPLSYTATLSVFGTMEEKRTCLNLLHAAFDHDIYNMTPGKIVHGDYEIECYITMSNTYYENPYIYNDLTIYCPYPSWKKERLFELRPSQGNLYPYLDFNYGFPYDYSASLPGYEVVENPGEAPCQYKLIIYGPAINPIVAIDGLEIGVNVSLGSAERVEISSVDKTVMQYGSITQNIFNRRLKGTSIFGRISSGTHNVVWNNGFSADLILYEERSEPLWI